MSNAADNLLSIFEKTLKDAFVAQGIPADSAELKELLSLAQLQFLQEIIKHYAAHDVLTHHGKMLVSTILKHVGEYDASLSTEERTAMKQQLVHVQQKITENIFRELSATLTPEERTKLTDDLIRKTETTISSQS